MSLDIVKLQKMAEKCSRNEPAYCENACPFSFDVKTFLKKMQDNKINSAYNLYKNTVLFPQIISSICNAPCMKQCVRASFGGSINIKKIEQACCTNAKKQSNHDYYIPKKNKTIVIVGGGLSGMGCAMKLSKRGYTVKLFEKERRLGGRLWEQLTENFNESILNEELQLLLEQEHLEVFTGHQIDSIDGIEFDAAFIATGTSGNKFGLQHAFDKNSLASEIHGVFFDATQNNEGNPANALRRGILAANEIESFLKVGRMEEHIEIYEKKPSELKMPFRDIDECKSTIKHDKTAISIEEAVDESQRCLLCGCSACVESCEMLSKYKKFPEKVIEDINATLNVMEGYTVRIASRQINSCNLCGSCTPKCPSDFDFENLFLESRRQMHKAGDIPPAYHDFWIRDMEHALSNYSFSVLPENENCDYLFFPGCQLGASDPDYVIKSYDLLSKCLENVGVVLSCCGAPAYWAGEQEKFEIIIDELKKLWISKGKPEIILACPHCGKLLKRYLSECSFKFIYEIAAEYECKNSFKRESAFAVFDPCSSREFEKLQKSIRHILQLNNFTIEELRESGKHAQCCGYGGHIHAVDNDLLENIVHNRIKGSAKDFITYCTNCRDIFASRGKRVCHILDILLFTEEESLESRLLRKVPDLSKRRRNREEAKYNMQLRFGIDNKLEKKERIKLYIDDALMSKMNKSLILEEDAQDVIEACEKSNCKLFNKNTGSYIAHLQSRFMTYWVEYKEQDDGFRLINIYCHRMEIQEEYNV